MRVCSKCCKFNFKHSDNIFARGLSAYREYIWCKAFLGYLCECIANAVSLISNILATFLREAYPHIGHVSSMANIVVIVLRLANDHYRAHFWVRLPVAYLYFCVRTFCVNISTGHAARPAHGDPIWLRLHIFALVCRGVIRHI